MEGGVFGHSSGREIQAEIPGDRLKVPPATLVAECLAPPHEAVGHLLHDLLSTREMWHRIAFNFLPGFGFALFCVGVNGVLLVTRCAHDTSLYYRMFVGLKTVVVAILRRCCSKVVKYVQSFRCRVGPSHLYIVFVVLFECLPIKAPRRSV